MCDDFQQSVLMEIDALKAIYMNDVEVMSDEKNLTHHIMVKLLPANGDVKTEQFVTMTLDIYICANYPNEVPKYVIHKTRGLSDENIKEIQLNIEKLASDLCGNSLLYDTIEHAKDLLTSYNFPTFRCSICLYEFTSDDDFIRNECYHHLHSRCLAEYVRNSLSDKTKDNTQCNDNVIPCPVCRQNIDIKGLKHPNKYPHPHLSQQSIDNENVMIEEAIKERKKFEHMFEKQKINGGIIDHETEKLRFFIRISDLENDETNNEIEHNDETQNIQQ